MIHCGNPRAQYLAHKDEIDAAVLRVLDNGWYILGNEVRAFESEFSEYIGVAHGIGVGSGTEALHLALTACGVGPGDEVITVAHTAVATVAAIELSGATPVLVDIDPQSFTLSPSKLEVLIGPRTKAIVPVHIYGYPADIVPILEIANRYGLRVIEDCAQAHGAVYRDKRVGAWGDIACFSFYPTKNLGALGDGGFVATNDADLADRARLLREYGWQQRYVSHVPGWNSRLDELQAAVLRIKLRFLDIENAARQKWASLYDHALAGSKIEGPPKSPYDAVHVYHLYVVRSPDRDLLQEFLRARGVQALVHYPVPVHLQPAYCRRLRGSDNLPETERAAREILSLPIYPELTQAEADLVLSSIHQYLEETA